MQTKLTVSRSQPSRPLYAAPPPSTQKVVEALDRAQERIQDLESALMVFFRVLRGESSFVQNSYELHVSKADYGKARDIYDRRSGDVALSTNPGEQTSPVMQSAKRAADVIDGWSDAKRDYAKRVMGEQE